MDPVVKNFAFVCALDLGAPSPRKRSSPGVFQDKKKGEIRSPLLLIKFPAWIIGCSYLRLLVEHYSVARVHIFQREDDHA